MQKSKCGDFRNPNSKRVATLFLSQSMATTQWNSAMLWQPRMKGGFGNNEGLDAGPSVHLLFIHFLHVGYQYIAINGFCWICFTLLNVGYRRAHPSLLTCSHSAPSGCLPYPEKNVILTFFFNFQRALPLVWAESKACRPVCRIRGTASLRYSRWTWLSEKMFDI